MGIYKAGKPFSILQLEAPDSYTKLLIHSNTTDNSTTIDSNNQPTQMTMNIVLAVITTIFVYVS